MQFLVHGSIAYDLLLGYDGSFPDAIDPAHLDELSVSFVAPLYKRHHGGTGANIAWNLKLLGQDPLLVGTVGTDGGPYTALLDGYKISTKHIERRTDAITATAIIATDTAERQITFFHPGADALGSHPDHEEFSDCVLCIIGPRNAVLMLKAAQLCEKNAIPYLFDPGQLSHVFGRDEFRRAVKGSRGMIVNEYEWALASEKLKWSTDDVTDACGLLVVTHGEEGLTLTDTKHELVVSAAKPDKIVNPTGAGDALRAGLLTGLGAGWSLEDAGRLGAVMGSFAVEYEGTLLPHLDLEDVTERFKSTYGKAMPKIKV